MRLAFLKKYNRDINVYADCTGAPVGLSQSRALSPTRLFFLLLFTTKSQLSSIALDWLFLLLLIFSYILAVFILSLRRGRSTSSLFDRQHSPSSEARATATEPFRPNLSIPDVLSRVPSAQAFKEPRIFFPKAPEIGVKGKEESETVQAVSMSRPLVNSGLRVSKGSRRNVINSKAFDRLSAVTVASSADIQRTAIQTENDPNFAML